MTLLGLCKISWCCSWGSQISCQYLRFFKIKTARSSNWLGENMFTNDIGYSSHIKTVGRCPSTPTLIHVYLIICLLGAHIDSLMQDSSNSIANALESPQSCTKSLIYGISASLNTLGTFVSKQMAYAQTSWGPSMIKNLVYSIGSKTTVLVLVAKLAIRL